jgi:hypothetical protein
MRAPAASPDSLPRLGGYPFDVRYSESARADAIRLADLMRGAYEYFARVLPGASPQFTAFLLAPEEWKRPRIGGPGKRVSRDDPHLSPSGRDPKRRRGLGFLTVQAFGAERRGCC